MAIEPRCQQCHRTEKDHAYTAPEVCWWTPPSPTTIEIPKMVFDRDRQRYMRFATAEQMVNVLREDGSVSASFGGTLAIVVDPTAQETLDTIARCWRMYAHTCEAFVVQVGFFLQQRGVDRDVIRTFGQRLLGVPDTSLVDIKRCATPLDADFAATAIAAARELLP